MTDHPCLIKHATGFIIVSEVDEKFLDVESYSLISQLA